MTDKSQAIVNQLTPSHITNEVHQSTEELKKEVAAATSPKPKEPSPSEDLKSKKEYPFDFSWTSPNGKVWAGKFVNKILSIAELQSVGLTRARFGGGMPSDSLDGLTHEINLIIAHMMYSLIEFPDWAKELRELEEIQLIQALYGEVASHEATFFGLGPAKEGS